MTMKSGVKKMGINILVEIDDVALPVNNRFSVQLRSSWQ
jgi:hypothetical protein